MVITIGQNSSACMLAAIPMIYKVFMEGGEWLLGEKNQDLEGKIKKGENCIKYKALKLHLFGI